MFCNKCGNKVNQNQKYCNKCGNLLTYDNTKTNENNKYDYNHINHIRKRKKSIILPITIGSIFIILIIVIILCFIFGKKQDNYYFSGDVSTNGENISQRTASNNTSNPKGKYKTAIITDNVYTGISINNIEDAKQLIAQDSLNQKASDYSKEIIQIENDIIRNYSITAVNLKEMDLEFAKELEKVVGDIYTNYPNARGYLTNLTLTNLDMSNNGVIALFMPMFMFGTSNTNTTRPWVIKTQVQLNAKYFLNPDRIESAVVASSQTGHFPKNATKYSPVAHEFGHYLSFIALLNHYSEKSIVLVGDSQEQNYYNILKDFSDGDFSKQMLDEAYQNYIKDYGNVDFNEWRGKISGYALAKDEAGNYIYDETIAEAFHDVYLNKDNANIVSKYITEVLKKYIEG